MDVNPVKRSSTFKDPGKEVYPTNGCANAGGESVFDEILSTLQSILAGQGVVTSPPTDTGQPNGDTDAANPMESIFAALEELIKLQTSTLQSVTNTSEEQSNTLSAVGELATQNNQSNAKIIECFEQLKEQNTAVLTALTALATASTANAEAQQKTADALNDQSESLAFNAKVAALAYQRANAPCPMDGCIIDGVATRQGIHEFGEDQYLLAYDDKGNACGYFRIAESVLGETETTVTIDPEHLSSIPECNPVTFECELAITSDAVRECIDVSGAISGRSFDNNCNNSA